jgi:putative DNA methylase
MVWDFAEAVPISDYSGSWSSMYERTAHSIEQCRYNQPWIGITEQFTATTHPLPDDSANALVTDPPYYDAVPYAYLSDFFYVWLRRGMGSTHPHLFAAPAVPKDDEIVVDRPHGLSNSTHDVAYYERELTRAFAEGRRILRPDGIGTIVFASKTTASWEAILQAVVDAGWTVTGSWPIDTEMQTRISAQGQARLASSVHIVCRPRETPAGTLAADVGDWREVLDELPRRIHGWMPRLAEEGIVGADAIFSCLGPALEIYSRYGQVERADGRKVQLREYLEQVWGVVANEALVTIFEGGDASGFEDDARLTAIWFWTLKTGENGNGGRRGGEQEDEQPDEEDEEKPGIKATPAGYVLEYDAARKLAQGLGVDLVRVSQPGGIVTIKGNIAALNRVSARARYLVGHQLTLFGDVLPPRVPRRPAEPRATMRQVRERQLPLMEPQPVAEPDPYKPFLPGMEPSADTRTLLQRLVENGSTRLDRLHQAMLLYAHNQAALLRPFLEEVGVSKDTRFWKLAEALYNLYPANSEEKRLVDGVLARKRAMGF